MKNSEEQYLKEYKFQVGNYKIITDVYLCGPAGHDLNGKKFDGAFPNGFLKRVKQAFKNYYPTDRKEILHVCSGRVPEEEGLRLDISTQYNPDFLCNAEDMILTNGKKIENELFQFCIMDAPYNEEAAKKYYNLKLLNKSKALKQMNRVTKIGGFIGILDEAMLQGTPRNLKVIALIGVRSVPNLDFRTFTVYRKIAPTTEELKAEGTQRMEEFF